MICFCQVTVNLIFFFTLKLHTCTMLQKLSKCEIKAWLCSNLIILPSLRFYMKYLGRFELSKIVTFGNFRDSELWIFGEFGTWKLLKLTNIKIQKLWNCQLWHFWNIWIRKNLISRKIGALTSHFESFWSIVQVSKFGN